jgi:hypothetical protein
LVVEQGVPAEAQVALVVDLRVPERVYLNELASPYALEMGYYVGLIHHRSAIL